MVAYNSDIPQHRAYTWIAEQWLRYDQRFLAGVVVADGDDFRGARQQFLNHLAAQRRDLHTQDIGALADAYFSNYKSLVEWYQSILVVNDVQIVFDQGKPVVCGDDQPFYRWLALVQYFDPDALVTLVSAKAGTRQLYNLLRWPMLVTSGDPDIQRLTERPLSDMHIHRGALQQPVPLLWQRLMSSCSGRMKLDELPRYSERTRRSLSPRTAWVQEILEERRHITRALELAMKPETAKEFSHPKYQHYLGKHRHHETVVFDPQTRDAKLPSEILFPERDMLLRVWKKLLRSTEAPSSVKSTEKLALNLDAYLWGKQRFRLRHLQPLTETSVGLTEFRAFSSARHAKGRLRPIKKKTSAAEVFRFVKQNDGLSVNWYTEIGNLKRVELRLKPFARVKDYHFLFRAWEQLERDLFGDDFHQTKETSFGGWTDDRPRGEGRTQIQFAVHFLRTFQRHTEPHPSRREYERKRLETDRLAAVLYRYMLDFDKEKNGTNWRIERLDIAGREREAPTHVFAPYIKLLRGDQSVVSKIRGDKYSHYFQKCRPLITQENADVGSLPRLGLTCHAGEDFFTPLDGLFQIDAALDGFEMRAGDAIGHGLAAGVVLDQFFEKRFETGVIPQGVQFDSMLWLFQKLCAEQSDVAAIERVSSWIRDHGHRIYGRHHEAITFARKLNFEFDPVPNDPRDNQDEDLPESGKSGGRTDPDFDSRDIWLQQIYNENVRRMRHMLVPVSTVQKELKETLEWAQQHVIDKLVSKGIVIETNPSSNIRIAGARDPGELPIINMLEKSNYKLRVTLCTDNPGVYDTHVANEYAILSDHLRLSNNKLNRTEIFDLLERIRSIGFEHIR